MLNQTLAAQAQTAFDAALNCPRRPDWRAVAELFRAAMLAEQVRRRAKAKATATGEIADYNVDRVKLLYPSPRIAVRFMDGEAVFTHVPSAPGKPLNIGRALRVAVVMYRSRKGVQRGAGFGNGRIVRRGRLQQAHGYGTPEQRSRTRGSDAGEGLRGGGALRRRAIVRLRSPTFIP